MNGFLLVVCIFLLLCNGYHLFMIGELQQDVEQLDRRIVELEAKRQVKIAGKVYYGNRL